MDSLPELIWGTQHLFGRVKRVYVLLALRGDWHKAQAIFTVQTPILSSTIQALPSVFTGDKESHVTFIGSGDIFAIGCILFLFIPFLAPPCKWRLLAVYVSIRRRCYFHLCVNSPTQVWQVARGPLNDTGSTTSFTWKRGGWHERPPYCNCIVEADLTPATQGRHSTKEKTGSWQTVS